MISALTAGFQATGNQKFLDAAKRAAAFILENMVRPSGQLFHSYKDQQARHPAYLDDYGGLVNGLVDLYESTFDRGWLDHGVAFAEIVVKDFWDETGDGFFYTGSGHETLIVRSKNPYDNATPSGNSLCCMGLLRLGTLMRRPDFVEKAERTLRRFQPYLRSTPNGFGQMICAADYVLSGGVEMSVVGGAAASEMVETIYRAWVPNRILAGGDLEGVPMTLDFPPSADPAVYVCRNQTCSAPVTSEDGLEPVLGPVRA